MKNLDQAKYHSKRADIKLSALQASGKYIDKEDYDRYIGEIRDNLERALLHIDELEVERMMDSMKEKAK